MQHPWWSPMQEFVRHTVVYFSAFLLFVLVTVYGSTITARATSAVHSRFIVNVLLSVEYILVVADASAIVLFAVRDLRACLKNITR